MTDSLITKQDLRKLQSAMDARFAHVDDRLDYLERHMDTRMSEQSARFQAQMADLERRVTFRLGTIMVAGIGAFSALVKLL